MDLTIHIDIDKATTKINNDEVSHSLNDCRCGLSLCSHANDDSIVE
jgi:hypothetical protein